MPLLKIRLIKLNLFRKKIPVYLKVLQTSVRKTKHAPFKNYETLPNTTACIHKYIKMRLFDVYLITLCASGDIEMQLIKPLSTRLCK